MKKEYTVNRIASSKSGNAILYPIKRALAGPRNESASCRDEISHYVPFHFDHSLNGLVFLGKPPKMALWHLVEGCKYSGPKRITQRDSKMLIFDLFPFHLFFPVGARDQRNFLEELIITAKLTFILKS